MKCQMSGAKEEGDATSIWDPIGDGRPGRRASGVLRLLLLLLRCY